MNSNRLYILLLLYTLLLLRLCAQTPPPDESFAFRVIGAGVISEDLYYNVGGKPVPIRINTEMRSPYYSYKGPRSNLTFYRQVPGPDGKPLAQPVGTIDLTGAGNRPLLIFVANPGAAGSYIIHPYADSSKDVPPGGFRFVNFTTRRIAMIFGEQKLIIPPAEQLIVKGDTVGTDAVNEVRMFGILLNDEIRAIYSNLWAVNPEMRCLVLISPTTLNATGAEVKCISEHVNQIPVDDEAETASEPSAKPLS